MVREIRIQMVWTRLFKSHTVILLTNSSFPPESKSAIDHFTVEPTHLLPLPSVSEEEIILSLHLIVNPVRHWFENFWRIRILRSFRGKEGLGRLVGDSML